MSVWPRGTDADTWRDPRAPWHLRAMRVQLLYFAALRDLFGRSEEDVSLADDVRTLRDLRGWLLVRTPSLGKRLDTVRFAIDEVFEDDDALIPGGATIALIPPVAGG